MMYLVRAALAAWVVFALGGISVLAGGDHLKAAIAEEGRSKEDLERDATSKPVEVMAFFGVKPGMIVVDMFASGGYYTELLAHAVGARGRVYAHNNQAYRNFIGKKMDDRLADARLPNVIRLDREVAELGLEPNSVDMIWMCLTYHDIYFTTQGWDVTGETLMPVLYRALKPGGVLAIIDHAAAPGTKQKEAQNKHRIDPDFAKQDIARFGFVFDDASDVLRNSDDDHSLSAFDPKIRRKTDRFVYRYRKPNQ